MRAATITSAAVLALSALAIASVGAEGQRTRHRPTPAAPANSTDYPANGMNSTMPDAMPMNGSMTPDAMPANGSMTDPATNGM